MYNAYVTIDEYVQMGYNAIQTADLDAYLTKASRMVDTLTFNRIRFDKLTDFQKEIIQNVVCEQAEFIYENAEAISSILSSYSINSVSMTFGTGFNCTMENGVPIQKTTYAMLQSTGLCWRGAI